MPLLSEAVSVARRLLQNGHNDPGDQPAWFHALWIGGTVLLFLFFAYHCGVCDNKLDPPRPEEDEYNRAGNEPLHIRACDVPRETAREFLAALHK